MGDSVTTYWVEQNSDHFQFNIINEDERDWIRLKIKSRSDVTQLTEILERNGYNEAK